MDLGWNKPLHDHRGRPLGPSGAIRATEPIARIDMFARVPRLRNLMLIALVVGFASLVIIIFAQLPISTPPLLRLGPLFVMMVADSVVLLMLLRLIWPRRAARDLVNRSLSRGICPSCSYDLKSLQHPLEESSRRCPECGSLCAADLPTCTRCGYDMRGSPLQSRDGCTVCPECGAAWRLPSAAA